MAYLVAGPFIALVGIVAVFFVFRRKSVDKRSMYSARRQQIEHKVRAARQRTLTPRGHEAKPAATAPAPVSPFDQTQAQAFEYFTPSTSKGPTLPAPAYQPSAFEPAAAAPPAPPPVTPPPVAAPPEPPWEPPAEPQKMPWDIPAAAASAPPIAPPPPPPSTFEFPSAPPAPVEPFKPAAEPTPRAQPSEPAWTPAPKPSPPATQIEQPVAPSSTSVGGWSIVTTTKESATITPEGKKGKKGKTAEVTEGSWALASGELPGTEVEEQESSRPSGTVVAVAQYAVLVVGLVMVLIGVLVMVANSHVS